jgi:hypothetical protein
VRLVQMTLDLVHLEVVKALPDKRYQQVTEVGTSSGISNLLAVVAVRPSTQSKRRSQPGTSGLPRRAECALSFPELLILPRSQRWVPALRRRFAPVRGTLRG